jgi:hypothetical protein
MYSVHRHSHAQLSLDRAEKWLLQKEVENNLILATAYLLTGDSRFEDPIYLATVDTDAEVCGCVVCPLPDGLYLTEIPILVFARDIMPLAVAAYCHTAGEVHRNDA